MAVVAQAEEAKELFSTTTALLTELFESSRNLPTASSDLGSIQLSLKEIQNRARASRKADADTNDTKAYVFMFSALLLLLLSLFLFVDIP